MRPLKNACEIAVIGGGLAGLAAARHAARLGRLVTLFESSGLFGGLVATVNEVEGLSVPGTFSGQDLAVRLLDELRKEGVRIIERGVASIALDERLTVTEEDGAHYPEAVIIASGASLRNLGVPGEEEFLGRGVSRCADCDGGFFRGQDVVVVGGGDAAVQEALILAKTSRRVIMVCRSSLTAKRESIDRLAARENVDFVWDSNVAAILGGDGVSGIRLRDRDGSTRDMECAGVFPFIGVQPNTGFAPESLLSETGRVKTDSDCATSDPRVFAAGAVRANYGGQLIEAMAEGVAAARAAARLCAVTDRGSQK